VSARKIGMLLLLLAFGATVETAWQVRGDVRIGPEGCRVMGGRFYGPSYTFEQTAERAVAAPARIEVRNAFGEVRLAAGPPGTVRVTLRKVVYQPTEEKARAFADKIELRMSGDGAPLAVGTNREDIDRRQDVGFETHLDIVAPPDTAVSVRNEHGRVEISGMAGADVVSSFDGVTVTHLAGDVGVESRHGDVSIGDVGGAATVTARQGSVELDGVRGRVRLDVEHGETKVRRTGAIEASQKYGGFTAESVAGDLAVRASHSEVDASDVTGHVEIETSFGGAKLARVGGGARAKAEHGRVEAEDVAGGLVAVTSHDGVVVHRVDGAVEIDAQRGSVEASGLGEGARVHASGGDVDLDGFRGAVGVEVERGSARLSPRAAIAGPITVSVRNGDVTLRVPDGSRATVEAESRRGEVRSELRELPVRENEHRGRGLLVKGTFGGGGEDVKIHADGDVTITAQGAASAIADRAVAPPSLASASPSPEAAPSPSPAVKSTPTASPAPSPRPTRMPAEAPKTEEP
jgi:DUF4097 and DUF4098 domain-containing protein YvlB